MKKSITLLLLVLIFVSCEKASNTVIAVPDAVIDCQESECNGALDGTRVVVFYTKSGCSAREFDPSASGNTTLSCDSNGCTGTVSSWNVTEMLTGFHDICANIDNVTENFDLDSGELVHESSRNIATDASISLESWSVSN